MQDNPEEEARRRFADTYARFGAGPVVILGHFDADGLCATAILARALDHAGCKREIRLVGKGENPWDPGFGEQLRALKPGGLIITDLGVREGDVLPGVPTVVIDHHVPTGMPGEAVVVSGNGAEPEPTSALLAYWCACAIADTNDLLWLAAMGLIGDMADDKAFAELSQAQARYGKTALRDAVSLINAPRRTAAADATPALTLLLEGDGPKTITKGDRAENAALLAAKAEVRAELEVARKVAPKVRGPVAMIRFHSPCQIHPLIAQQWRGRLKSDVILAVNTGYRAGWVHFAARSGTGCDLIEWLAAHRPVGADSHYGSGHRAASGGALKVPQWNEFVQAIGFSEEAIADALPPLAAHIAPPTSGREVLVEVV